MVVSQIFSSLNVYANMLHSDGIEITEMKSTEKDSINENEGKYGFKSAITDKVYDIDGISLTLFPEFVDQNQAINEMEENCPNVIAVLQKTYELDDFSSDNWKEYRDKQIEYLENPEKKEWYTEYNTEYGYLDGFFDIFENHDQNKIIIDEMKKMGSIRELSKHDEIIDQLPWKTIDKFKKELSEKTNTVVTKTKLQLSSSAATTYAIKYATSPNKKVFGYVQDHDCTNFASQIMNAGGNNMTPLWMCVNIECKGDKSCI